MKRVAKMRVHDVTTTGLADVARHLMGCTVTKESKVLLAVDDVASNIRQALERGGHSRAGGRRRGGGSQRLCVHVRRLGAQPDGGAGEPLFPVMPVR
jgi:hypothetical protein